MGTPATLNGTEASAMQEVARLLGRRVLGVPEVDDRAVVLAEELVDVAEDVREAHLVAPGKALALADRGEELLPRRARRHREDGRDGRVRVRVGSADERERAALLLRGGQEVLDERVVLVGHRAVLDLEDVEELEHRREEVLGSLPHPVRLEEMVRGVEEFSALRYSTRSKMFRRFRSMTFHCASVRSKTFTWIRWPVRGKNVSISAETKKSA